MGKNKIAFLFLIIDNPNFPEVWDYYFNNNYDKINIYIHPKYPENHTWKPECIIKNLQPTKWGFIVDAYMELFKEASKNSDNIKFVTISESCLPIKPFSVFFNSVIIEKPNVSLIKTMKISKYDYDVRLSNDIKKQFNTHLIKHYARMCLSKYHVNKLISHQDKVKIFSKMHVGDEFFLSSITPLKYYEDFAVTHDDWEYVHKIKTQIKDMIKLLYEKQEKKNIENTKKNIENTKKNIENTKKNIENTEKNIENTKKNIDYTKKIIELKNKFNDIAKNPKNIVKVTIEDINNIKKTKSFFYRKLDKKSDIKNYIFNFI